VLAGKYDDSLARHHFMLVLDRIAGSIPNPYLTIVDIIGLLDSPCHIMVLY